MPAGEPFTPCTLRRDFGDEIPEGAFLVAATTAYRVERVRGRTLHVTRWPLAEVPEDAELILWSWTPRRRAAGAVTAKDCISCAERMEQSCPESPKPCGHHCNHSWTHDACCWCGKEWGGEDG